MLVSKLCKFKYVNLYKIEVINEASKKRYKEKVSPYKGGAYEKLRGH